ncbi:hypothetical protein F5Y04DRAFT_289384 [Hypomontagnella monticulosa]|nr:hypothetical protein F5Y04DRAFT_289384 [Hypomontagnella monticulosa]
MRRSESEATEDLKIIVGVDFGTTYSAVAYVKTTDPNDQITINEWGLGMPTAPKVPTLLKYQNDDRTQRCYWGFQAQDQGGKKHEWFKLDLHPHIEQSELARKYPSTTALPPLKGSDCEELVTEYLEKLRLTVDEYFWTHEIDTDPRNPIPRQYVITVPAMWPEGAQAATRRCAQSAGMGDDIRIISEPEAAGIYALDKMRAIGLEVGDTFVVCDAGGGTVDLVSYTVTSLDPPRVEEAASGSGGMCGSSFLNRIFAKHLQDKFRGYNEWDDDFQDEALKEFEVFKQRFLGTEDFVFRVRSLRDNHTKGIKKGFLRIKGADIAEKIFKPVTKMVQDLVRKQVDRTTKKIEKTGRTVKRVLLAGGFGQSDYLRRMIEMELRPDGIRVQKVENSNTAIVRGALSRGLVKEIPRLPIFIPEARIARKHYGTKCWVDFDPQKYDPSRAKEDELTGKSRVEIMQWFVKKHASIVESKAEKFHFRVDQEYDHRGTHLKPGQFDIYVYDDPEDEGAPDYKVNGVKRMVKLSVEFDEIPRGAITTRKSLNGTEFAAISFMVEMKLYSANLGFSIVLHGKRYEEVTVEFES